MVSRIFPLIFIIIAFSNEKNTLWIYRSNRILLQIVTIVSHHGREICRMFWLRRDKVGRHMDMKKERQTGIWAWDLLTWKSSRVNCSEHSTPVLPADSICWLKLRWPWTWNVAFEHSLEDDRVPPAEREVFGMRPRHTGPCQVQRFHQRMENIFHKKRGTLRKPRYTTS